MHHVAHACTRVPVTRNVRRWRRMRARLGLAALWTGLLVWALGASVRVPGEDMTLARHVDAPAAASLLAPHVDLERAAAWPRESADAALAPSHEPTPEEEAALYIAGR